MKAKLENDKIEGSLMFFQEILTLWLDDFIIGGKWIDTDNRAFFYLHKITSKFSIERANVHTIVVLREISKNGLKESVLYILIEHSSSIMIVGFGISGGHWKDIMNFLIFLTKILILGLQTHFGKNKNGINYRKQKSIIYLNQKD